MTAKCLFGRQHRWTSRGKAGAVRLGNERREVYLCGTCGLVEDTGRKVALECGSLFTAEKVAAEVWKAERKARKAARG